MRKILAAIVAIMFFGVVSLNYGELYAVFYDRFSNEKQGKISEIDFELMGNSMDQQLIDADGGCTHADAGEWDGSHFEHGLNHAIFASTAVQSDEDFFIAERQKLAHFGGVPVVEVGFDAGFSERLGDVFAGM